MASLPQKSGESDRVLSFTDFTRFHQFFNHIDNYNQPHFLYLTSKGFAATQIPLTKKDQDAPAAKTEAAEASAATSESVPATDAK